MHHVVDGLPVWVLAQPHGLSAAGWVLIVGHLSIVGHQVLVI
jgi:hypothetical protein